MSSSKSVNLNNDFGSKVSPIRLVPSEPIDKASLDLISKILSRPIEPEKSNQDYNKAYVSRLDSATMRCMEMGLRDSLNPGDLVRITAWLQKHVDKNLELTESLEYCLNKKSGCGGNLYSDPLIPFNAFIAEDILAKYILRTEQGDTFESIFFNLESNKSKFISNEDWSIITSAIKTAENRIKNEDLIFLTPATDGVTGNHRELTADEKTFYGFDPAMPMDADFRKDDHDLVSLKALSYVMQGNKVETLSPFAGAFLKYLPELNTAGIRAVIFEVTDDVLTAIKLSKFLGKDKIPYAPVEAGIAVAQCYPEVKDFQGLKQNVKFYVSVSGFVCGPEDFKIWGYKELTPKLNKAVPAGECLLFHFNGDRQIDIEVNDKIEFVPGPAATRLYFYPYKPTDMHPGYHKMTVIYGISDNMYHSCGHDPEHKFFDSEYEEIFKDNQVCLDYQPTARWVYNKIILPISKFYPPGCLYFPKGKEKFGKSLGEEMSNSYYGENEYAVDKYLHFALTKPNLPNDEALRVKEMAILSYVCSVPSSFLFYEYIKGIRSGLKTKPVFITVYRLPKCDTDSFTKGLMNNLNTGAAFQEVNKSLDKGNDAVSVMKNLWKKLGK